MTEKTSSGVPEASDGDPLEFILYLEHRMGLPLLSFCEIAKDRDDWAYIMRMSAFLEGALKVVLDEIAKVERSLAAQLCRCESHRERLRLATRIGAVEPDYERFLRKLAQFRNKLAHEPAHIQLDLRKYVNGLPWNVFEDAADALAAGVRRFTLQEVTEWAAADPKFDGLKQAFSWVSRPVRTIRGVVLAIHPRMAIWMSAALCVEMFSCFLILSDFEAGRAGKDEAKGCVQDLMHDPKVLEFRHGFGDVKLLPVRLEEEDQKIAEFLRTLIEGQFGSDAGSPNA